MHIHVTHSLLYEGPLSEPRSGAPQYRPEDGERSCCVCHLLYCLTTAIILVNLKIMVFV